MKPLLGIDSLEIKPNSEYFTVHQFFNSHPIYHAIESFACITRGCRPINSDAYVIKVAHFQYNSEDCIRTAFFVSGVHTVTDVCPSISQTMSTDTCLKTLLITSLCNCPAVLYQYS